MAEELLFRKDVKKELTWDLSLIYKDEDALMADAARLESLTAQLEKDYKGRLDSADRINECLDKLREIYGIVTLVGNYCELATSVDYYDTQYGACRQDEPQDFRVHEFIKLYRQ